MSTIKARPCYFLLNRRTFGFDSWNCQRRLEKFASKQVGENYKVSRANL